jgi:hypothetical protein
MPVLLLPYLAILPKPAKYIYNLLLPHTQSRQARQSIQYQQTLQTPIFFIKQAKHLLLLYPTFPKPIETYKVLE